MKALYCLLLVLLAPSALAARYRIDPAHTYAYFAVDHMDFSLQRGRFDRTSGSLELDVDARRGKVDIRIEAASLSTGDAARDRVLKGRDFFDVGNHPHIEFKGDEFLWEGDALRGVEGRLTLCGVTRPLQLTVSRFRCAFNPLRLARTCGADAYFTVRRSEFGMDGWLSAVGDEVRVDVQVEALRE